MLTVLDQISKLNRAPEYLPTRWGEGKNKKGTWSISSPHLSTIGRRACSPRGFGRRGGGGGCRQRYKEMGEGLGFSREGAAALMGHYFAELISHKGQSKLHLATNWPISPPQKKKQTGPFPH